jgi:hypothetical protein
MPCWACGKRYPQHLDVMDPRATPRVPCLLLKANFWPDIKHAPAPPPTEPSTQCKRCDMYRTTLRAIANAGDNGVNGGGLADLARLALLTGKAET